MSFQPTNALFSDLPDLSKGILNKNKNLFKKQTIFHSKNASDFQFPSQSKRY